MIVFSLTIIIAFFSSPIFRFYKESYTLSKKYYIYRDLLNHVIDTSDSAQLALIPFSNFTYKDIRIVIIGESVRKDYLSVYGYPHETTPFLDRTQGIFIDGFISPSSQTIFSLLRMLIIPSENEQIGYGANNAVNIANMAGYETFWISNQGSKGHADVAVSRIAQKSLHTIFLNHSEWTASGDDFEILPHINKILDTQYHKEKLLFIHMIGSHPRFCRRVENYQFRFDLLGNKDANCYLSTIHKLDSFIQSIISELEEKKLSYSLIYFSDHGLMSSDNPLSFMHDARYQYRQSFEVPLFVLDSDIHEHIVIKRKLSGFHFMDIFASWIGVETNMTDPRYTITDFPEDTDIKISDGQSIRSYDDLQDNPVVTSKE
ncbi:hypothetical protein AGMMS50229_07370 [Campylobacterota bacterium]|nr:hypothetical protein AGMMS50229_07370 [Campylobacterota bacterium]